MKREANLPHTTGAAKTNLFDDIKKEEEEDDEEDGNENSNEEAEVDEFGRRIREEDRIRKKGLLPTYKFKVCDNLLNIGPIADMAVGESFDAASVSLSVYLPSPRLEPCARKVLIRLIISGTRGKA